MPFSEEERRSLENDGRFSPMQIRILERVQMNYDNVKRLQDALLRYVTQQERTNATLRQINDIIMSDLQEGGIILDRNGIADETKLNRYIEILEANLIQPHTTQSDEDSSDGYSSDEQSHSGGKKRRKSRRKKSRRKSRRKSRKGRKSRRKA